MAQATKLAAMCMPILPGKKGKWQAMMDQLNKSPMKEQIDASRSKAGVRERTFLQQNPDGSEWVIVTLEGDNPMEAFGKMMADPSMREFAAWAADVHGMDLKADPPPPPRLVYDSKG